MRDAACPLSTRGVGVGVFLPVEECPDVRVLVACRPPKVRDELRGAGPPAAGGRAGGRLGVRTENSPAAAMPEPPTPAAVVAFVVGPLLQPPPILTPILPLALVGCLLWPGVPTNAPTHSPALS